MKLFPLLLVAFMAASGVCGATVAIEDDGMLNVDGKRLFVLGLYEHPKDDAKLGEAAGAGFNLVHASADVDSLNRLWEHGLYGWVNTGYAIDFSDNAEQGMVALRELAQSLSAHPGLLVWEVPDEALWNAWYRATQWRRGAEPRQQNELIAALTDASLREKLEAMRERAESAYATAQPELGEAVADDIWRELGKEPPHPDLNLSNAAERAAKLGDGMAAGYAFLKQLDPAHPVWMNHAPRNSIKQLAFFNRGADIVGCDIYPVPLGKTGHSDLGDRTLACVGAYTRRMQTAAPGKPVWMVLQGFGWADLNETADAKDRAERRKPTPDESRFMAYDAIVNGARGILYWGTAYIGEDTDFWKELRALIQELSALQHVLSARDAAVEAQVALAETWGSLDRGVRVLPKQVGDQVHFLVVNEWLDPLRYTLTGLDSLNGKTYKDAATGATATVEAGALSLPIRNYGVHVLQPAD
ncbi:MAG TPA: hypothetical protein ENN29_09615 [Candidatus Hydrogenedentes bacterium]|nr:hypothetical protein [Candidatus Hydrogenedentota bacterium]